MIDPDEKQAGLERALTFYDVTNITVGAIVGADIYIAAAITAGILGPASLLAWLLAAVLATVIALMLAECARLVPDVGGPFAYASHAFGPMVGFLAGWSMWIAELMALPVFAIAFTNYLGYFVDLSPVAEAATRIAFLALLTAVNVRSVKAAGRFNDALTALKLAPLLLLIVGGAGYIALHWDRTVDNLTPFAPFGLSDFPRTLLLVIWAYMGFELSTVPSGEVKEPARTIPRALATGMAIVATFYLTTNVVLYSLVPHTDLAESDAPLLLAATIVFGGAGAVVMAVGAMISVSGSDESDMLGSSRLGYAMAAHGLLPRALGAVHPRYHTPHVALIVQCGFAVALIFVNQLPELITFAVFNLAFSFFLCSLAAIRLHRTEGKPVRLPQRVVPFVALIVSGALLAATSLTNKLIGAGVLGGGLVIYFVAGPGEIMAPALARLTNVEHQLELLARHRMRFLGGLVGWLGGRRSPGAP